MASPLVLDGISLDVCKGDIVGVLGPNGSGKTTLLRVLSGVEAPLTGEVTLDGVELRTMNRRAIAQRIAVVPQQTQLAFEYSVIEVVLMGRYPHLGAFALEGPADFDAARAAMTATNTAHLEDRPFETLSGGEQQRVVIAAALAQGADVLLLDEPTTSLDPGAELDVLDVLRELNQANGVTIVVSTHDLQMAARFCDRLTLLREGRVLAEGPTETVLTPGHIEALYGVDASVERHPASGSLVVVPIARAKNSGRNLTVAR